MLVMNTVQPKADRQARRKPLRVGAFRQDAAYAGAVERVKTWTRECLKLSADDTIIVSEMACGLPGCPPLETVVAFWTDGDKRHVFKVFKPVAEVVMDDLPPSWLKNSLCATEGMDFSCC
jgi:nitrate reductase delta subunit